MRVFSTIALLATSSLAAGANSSTSSATASASSSASSSATSAASAASTASTTSTAPACAKGLYMVVARGSGEPVGPGSAVNITDQVQQAIPGSVVAPVDYPATLENYEGSESAGVAAMHELLEAYQKACPTSKTAIIGYSQGAQIAMDTVCGGIGGIFTSRAAVSSAVLDNVVAVNVFGDPGFVINLPYDIGTSVQHGIFPRNNTASCLAHKSIVQSFCDKGDIYCAGGQDLVVHHTYIENYGPDMVKFIVDKYRAAVSGSGTTEPSGTAKPSGTGAPTAPSGSKNTSLPNAAGSMASPAAALLGAAVVAVMSSFFSLA